MTNRYHTPLLPDNFYHVFNRAVGSDKLFNSPKDYCYFLRKMKYYIVPVADVFAYSLMPNHFHLVLRAKPFVDLVAYFESKKRVEFCAQKHDISDFIMERFANWLNGYAKVFNYLYNRKGALFIDYTKRIEASAESDILSFILYTHQNAVHHGLVQKIGDWPFDSFKTLLGFHHTFLMRKELMQWFGSKDRFKEFHDQPIHVRTKKIIQDLTGLG